MNSLETLRFLNQEEVIDAAAEHDTPLFVYDEASLRAQADEALAFNAPFGLEVRYAMKANSHREILRIFADKGLGIDASSGFEAERAILAGIKPSNISITSQELPKNLKELVEEGVDFNACSLHQLREYGKLFPGTKVGVRINPGSGTGHSPKTNVGGPLSSFGIWHEYLDEVLEVAEEYDLEINRLHTHIGTGGDPQVWTDVARMTLEQVKRLPDVTTVDFGGGFKVARMQNEVGTKLSVVGPVIADAIKKFYEETGRKLKLEIEPGTFLVANAGSLITTIRDIVDTGKAGHQFIKIDSGMTEVLRPSLYGAQHPLVVVNDRPLQPEKYVVVGHACESGDLLTPKPGEPEVVDERLLQHAEIDDLLVIEGVGAYCASMSADNYCSFPSAAAFMRRMDGKMVLISKPGSLEEVTARERNLSV